MKTCEYATVVENKRLTKDVYSIILKKSKVYYYIF